MQQVQQIQTQVTNVQLQQVQQIQKQVTNVQLQQVQQVAIPDILKSDRLETKIQYSGGGNIQSKLIGRDKKAPGVKLDHGAVAGEEEQASPSRRWLEMRSKLTAELLRDRNQRLRRNILELDTKLGNRQKWAETVLLLRDLDRNQKSNQEPKYGDKEAQDRREDREKNRSGYDDKEAQRGPDVAERSENKLGRIRLAGRPRHEATHVHSHVVHSVPTKHIVGTTCEDQSAVEDQISSRSQVDDIKLPRTSKVYHINKAADSALSYENPLMAAERPEQGKGHRQEQGLEPQPEHGQGQRKEQGQEQRPEHGQMHRREQGHRQQQGRQEQLQDKHGQLRQAQEHELLQGQGQEQRQEQQQDQQHSREEKQKQDNDQRLGIEPKHHRQNLNISETARCDNSAGI
jgi:hypothetical protein